MKKHICAALAVLLTVSAMTLVSCGKKHTIDTDIAVDGSDAVSGKAGVVYETVTDAKGENVTDAHGEAVTVAVTVPAEESTTAANGHENTAKKNETTTAKPAAGNNETTAAKNETTTKKNEAATKKNETTTKKNETTQKQPTTQKTEPTTKKQEPTTAKPTTTQAPVVNIKDGEYEMTIAADKTTVQPGDTITVTLRLKNCRDVKSFGMEVRAVGNLSATDSDKNLSAKGLNMEINTAAEEGALIGGYFKDSYSFDTYDLCTITYKVSENAVKGETLVLTAVPTSMNIGTGNGAGVDYSDAMQISYLYISVSD